MYGESRRKATNKYRKDKAEIRALVDDGFKNRVIEYCKLYNLSQNEMIRKAVEEYMKKNG